MDISAQVPPGTHGAAERPGPATRRVALVALNVTLASLGLLLVGLYSDRLPGRWGDAYLTGEIKFQLALLAVSLASLGLTYLIDPAAFRRWVRVGRPNAPSVGFRLLGMPGPTTWMRLGGRLCVVVSAGLIAFIAWYVHAHDLTLSWDRLPPGLVPVLGCALANSFSEEAIYRVGILVPLAGRFAGRGLVWTSAIVFGLIHAQGTPSGPVGIVLAGVLGFVLARSVLETRGLFWAWSIHFIQDVIIFAALLVSGVSTIGS
jgi:membrane protease YdiL (CAAX protease family)